MNKALMGKWGMAWHLLEEALRKTVGWWAGGRGGGGQRLSSEDNC